MRLSGTSVVIATAALLVAIGGRPSGQGTGESAKRSSDKGRAPVSNALPRVTMPRLQSAELSNGVKVVVVEDRRAPQARIQLVVRGGGGFFDPPDGMGLAQFTADNSLQGTATRSAVDIAEQLDRVAATLAVSAEMNAEDATFAATVLTEHLDAVLDMMADVVQHPTFPSAEWARYRTQVAARLAQQRTDPDFLARERVASLVAGSHPEGRIAPSSAVLNRTTPESLMAFHRERYVPDHSLVAIVGDVRLPVVVKKLESRFGGWRASGRPMPRVSDPAAVTKSRIQLVSRPGSTQTDLLVGVQGVRRTDPAFYASRVVNEVLGWGPASRLNLKLREEKGYSYGAYTRLVYQRWPGQWFAYSQVRHGVVDLALSDLLAQLRQIGDAPIPAKELDDKKRALVSRFAVILEQPQYLMENVITQWRYNLPVDYWDGYVGRIMAVTAEDARAVATKHWNPARWQIVAVGNEEAVAPTLRRLGVVEVYDTDGRMIRTY